MPNRILDITTDGDKSYTGYLSLPPSGRGPGLVLLQEIYGVNQDIRAIADHYANAGYVVLAPDLFWRKESNLDIPYAERPKAGAIIGELGGLPPILADLPLAFEALRSAPEFDGTKVGIVGLGFGGVLAYIAAARKLVAVDAGVTFFPGAVDPSLASEIAQPWQFHFAGEDAVVQPRNIEQLTREAFANRADVSVHRYEGMLHGFAVPGRVEYDAIAAREATIRALTFLTDTVGWRSHE